MKKILSLLVLSTVTLLSAQVTRFVYEVEMRPNKGNKEVTFREEAYLDVSDQHSTFVSANALKRDSLMSRMRQTRSFDRTSMENFRSIINYTVEKDLSNQTITYKERIGRDQYEYKEDRAMEWKIHPETAQIGEYKAQKATTQFGGRDWEAWFTMEVPFPEGPYKFSGLPGLILKIEDTTGSYSFDLKESKNIAKISGPENTDPRFGSVISVKRSGFEKQKERYLKDPVAFMTASAGAARGGFNRGGARPIDPQRQRQMQERLSEEVSNQSNPIELK